MPMVPLVILIGVPGSGKSTIAQRWQQREPGRTVVSTDSIRRQLFGDAAIQGSWTLVWREVRDRWKQGIAVIQAGQQSAMLYDATHANCRDRRRAIATARQLGFTAIDGYWLKVPIEVCLERNRRRSRQVPDFVIRRMDQQLQRHPPTLSDGLDHLYTLEGDLSDLWCLHRD